MDAPGPYAFPPGLQWQPMHGAAKGCFEIREEQTKTLYRLFKDRGFEKIPALGAVAELLTDLLRAA